MSYGTDGYGGHTRTLGDRFYPLYRYLFDEDGDFVDDVQRKLAAARMADTVEMYLSRALAIGVIAGGLLWLLASLSGYAVVELFVTEVPKLTDLRVLHGPALAVFEAVKLPLLVLLSGLVCGLVGFVAGFGTLVAVPYVRANSRKREINMLLADSVSFMYALSIGGLNQLEIFEAMADADDTYGAVAAEFESIHLETEYFDTDYRTAIRKQALRTPSEELSQFLTDMLSIIDSGGDMTDFLNDKKDKHLRTTKQEQSLVLETLELFGEMYITLSVFPLLLIIILVVMSMIGGSQTLLLYVTVYGLIPLIGIGFTVMVSTVKQDEVGDGYLHPEGDDEDGATTGIDRISDLGLVERYTDSYGVFERVKSREGTHRTMELLANPHHFFRDHPLAVLALTLPASIVLVAFAVVSGRAPTSVDGFIEHSIVGTVLWVYVPLYVNCLPVAVFYEWNVRTRRHITGKLSENLRKLSSANSTGLTLLESLNLVADTSSGRLAEEFHTMYAKVNYGTNLTTALVEFNNKYHIPRLSRTVNVVSKAQEASSQITEVLSTAARASENQDEIEREQRSQARMQIVIIVMTFFTLLAVMAILKTNFLDTLAGLDTSGAGGQAGLGANIDVELMGMLFFHAVTIQGIMSGFIAGYIRSGDLLTGAKFAVVLPTFALAIFAVI
ncbi:transmembrane protein (type II secretion system proteins TadC) [Halococcus morrhuae DSM 1307]|uniref:Transmembrane protein (Type II secretion system proteins TadC) n=1 Tax=Halococcus morrhuae DSM 1307 TaxID=931277 RepID=M0MSI4_HALMO|nr:type II secretion system F family protein [Halococcus morrhuae]EMA47709.1 transmembrane protein (type II secretion system proteins TadC) [Halococcus morrhuae DSM 1307]